MKSLKTGMLALLMLVGNFVWAQQKESKTPEQRATEHSQKLTQQLGLSADQQKTVYAACLQRAQQMEADRAKNQGDRAAMKAAREQSNQTFDASMDKILTADQKTKYEQIKQDEQAKRQQGGGHRGGE
jgi:protein CpxP